MTDMSDPGDLVAFIRARLDEIEGESYWTHHATCEFHAPVDGGFPCTCGYPARVLRDMEAKRRIVDDHAPDPDLWCQARSPCKDPDDADLLERMPCRYVRWLGTIWSDHAEYREDWAPVTG
jgi:hypothetical protein